MKIKTAELIGKALCYAVCKIEMPHLVWGETIGIHHASDQIVVPELPSPDCYSPFMGWAQGGQIIERELIEITPDISDGVVIWHSERWPDYSKPCSGRGTGSTPLIATMRCYVASKLGNEVEIPEELV